MDIFVYISLFILYGVCGYLIYQNISLKRKIEEQGSTHKKTLSETGNAIVNAIKVAFDAIKTMTHTQDKMKKDIKENTFKIEQFMHFKQMQDARQKHKESAFAREKINTE